LSFAEIFDLAAADMAWPLCGRLRPFIAADSLARVAADTGWAGW
jgi:hypothetical protein